MATIDNAAGVSKGASDVIGTMEQSKVDNNATTIASIMHTDNAKVNNTKRTANQTDKETNTSLLQGLKQVNDGNNSLFKTLSRPSA